MVLLNMVEIVHFIVCDFYHNLKKIFERQFFLKKKKGTKLERIMGIQDQNGLE